MPELPDLHVFADNLKKRILNKKIDTVTINNIRKIDTPKLFCEKVAGTSIKDIFRNGKELYFLLENDNCFSVHLMLSGKFFIAGEDETEKINSKIVTLFFEDSQSFIIADYQGLCKITLNPNNPNALRVPDVMSDKFTLEYFSGLLKRNALKNIKAVLIDQNVARGIGNAYADEILWKANISPESTAGKIPDEKAMELYEAISFVLNDAIKTIQKISPDIISGEERSFLRVHNPGKKSTDSGEEIIIKTIASKKTYFTKSQILFI